MSTKTCTDAELADLLSHFIECVSLSHLDLLATILKRYELTAEQHERAKRAYVEVKQDLISLCMKTYLENKNGSDPNRLQTPDAYVQRIKELRKTGSINKNLPLRLEKKENRHVCSNGYPWGWYEVWPLDETVGYWGKYQDDLKGVDIKHWNQIALYLLEGSNQQNKEVAS